MDSERGYTPEGAEPIEGCIQKPTDDPDSSARAVDGPPLDASLSMAPDTMRALGYRVVDMIVDHFETVEREPVGRVGSRHVLENLLREPIPEDPQDVNTLLDHVRRDVLSYIARHDHPRFFAFVPSPSNYVSVLADALASGFNVFNGGWLGASGPAQVELVVIEWLRQLCGLPQGTAGLLVASGSMANLTALAVARHAVLGDDIARATIYYSNQTHASVDKSLALLGFRKDQIRIIPPDSSFRLPVAEVARLMREDTATGKRPFCVVANAGTTNTGAVDPLDELAELCRESGVWVHADGAYGAAAALTKRGTDFLTGLSDVDSLSIDPHKWLFQPYEIGCTLVRDGTRLPETFRLHADYLQDTIRNIEEINFADYGFQLTRSFRALKLWLSLKAFGLRNFREAVERGMGAAEIAEAMLRRAGCWEIVTPAQLGIVTFRYAGADSDALNRRLVSALEADGYAMLSSTQLDGRTVLRLCTINPRTTHRDLQETITRLGRLAAG